MSNEAKHTPGPWETHAYSEANVSVRHYLGNGLNQTICDMLPGKTPAQRDANARLIAAAPELLAELHSLAELVEATFPAQQALLLAGYRALVARIEGA